MMRATRPLYLRVLRVRHLRPGWLTTLVLFEGSCFAGALMTLAEKTQPWAMLVLPAAVAVVVKFNDSIAGALKRPLAVAQLNTPGPRGRAAIGRSPVPRPSRLTTSFSTDDAQPDPEARPGGDVARGVASVPGSSLARVRRPRPGVRPAAGPEPAIPDEPGPEQLPPDYETPKRPPRGNPGHFT